MAENQSGTKKWYAVYTRPKCEKKVSKYLREEGIDTFLPLQKTIRQWSDRKKKVEVPLFTSYVFVHVYPNQYYKVLEAKGIVCYVTFEGKAVCIPDQQINNLKLLVDSNIEINVFKQDFKPGNRVEILLGPLKGLQGELISHVREKHLLIRINQINQNLLINIPTSFLKIIN